MSNRVQVCRTNQSHCGKARRDTRLSSDLGFQPYFILFPQRLGFSAASLIQTTPFEEVFGVYKYSLSPNFKVLAREAACSVFGVRSSDVRRQMLPLQVIWRTCVILNNRWGYPAGKSSPSHAIVVQKWVLTAQLQG